MKNHTVKFRPGSPDPVRRMQARRKGQPYYQSSFVNRHDFSFNTPSQRVLGKAFGVMHYLACHAPAIVQKQWMNAYRQFEAVYFGNRGNGSTRFLNRHTCHAWM